MKIYSIVYKDQGKKYNFQSEEELNINDYVIVETERGQQFAKVVEEVLDYNQKFQLKNIIRKANQDDIDRYYSILKDNQVAFNKCKKLVKELNLDMNIIEAEFTFEKNQLLFNFIADERVDFRELAKRLASIYHTRIELRQVGARDKAKIIGGVGVCGRTLCCSGFLNHIDTITMNMAKNQNLALNPTKINGACGRLLCCLQYEDDNYIACSKGMPSIGDDYKTNNGVGKVVSVDILNRKFKVLVDGNKEEITLNNEKRCSTK